MGRHAERLFREVQSRLHPQEPDVVLGADYPAIAGAEIAAVVAGRKPLYHEHLTPLLARCVASGLVPVLPRSIVALAKLGHLVVFNETLMIPLLNTDRTFYHRPAGESVSWPVLRAVESGDCGELLGYGSRRLFGAGQVLVRLWDGNRLLAGFHAPRERAEEFAAARAFDYQDYLAREIRITIG